MHESTAEQRKDARIQCDHLAIERQKILKQFDAKFTGCYIAGGALTATFTNRSIKDFDLYFKSKQAFKDAIDYAYDHSFWCVAVSGRAITFVKGKQIYQLMSFRFFETPESIFEAFDFTCCMGALDVDTSEFHLHSRFLIDASRRDLVFNPGTAFPLASAIRVLKYQQRGYTMQKREWLKLAMAISFKKIESWEELKDQVGGAYGDQIALDTSKPFCLANVLESLETSHTESRFDTEVITIGDTTAEVPKGPEVPGNADDALAMIFPQEFAKQCRDEAKAGA